MAKCMFCEKGIADPDIVKLEVMHSRTHTGRYSEYLLCEECCKILQREINRAVHNVWHDVKMRSG